MQKRLVLASEISYTFLDCAQNVSNKARVAGLPRSFRPESGGREPQGAAGLRHHRERGGPVPAR